MAKKRRAAKKKAAKKTAKKDGRKKGQGHEEERPPQGQAQDQEGHVVWQALCLGVREADFGFLAAA